MNEPDGHPSLTRTKPDGPRSMFTSMTTGRIVAVGCLLAMVVLPSADRLALVVELDRLRTIRLVDVALLVLGAFAFLQLWATQGFRRLIRSSIPLAIVAAALVLLIVVNSRTCDDCARHSFASPTTLFRGLALLVASHVLFVTYTAEQRNRGLLLCAGVATIWAIGSTFLLLNSQWAPFLLYSETPYLHQPFSSPVQAATFSGVMLLLATGAALAINRPKLLYLLVPAFTLAIAQAGSRSGMVLLVLSWSGFVALFAGREGLIERRGIPRNLVHLFASALVAAAAVGILRSPEMSRSLVFVGVDARQIASGGPDEYRSRVWKDVIEGAGNGRVVKSDDAPGGGDSASPTATGAVGPDQTRPADAAAPDAGLQSAETERAPSVEAPHNVYLEFLLYGGFASMIGLIAVVLLLCGLTVRYAWDMRRSAAFPFASGLMCAVLFVTAINYGNVTLHLTFVWVLFGLVTASSSTPLRSAAQEA